MKDKKPIIISGTKSAPMYPPPVKGKKAGGCGCGKSIKKK